MPGLDHKGPIGQGAMTGRKMGRCTNYGASLKTNVSSEKELEDKDLPEGSPDREGFGRGSGFGRGRGFGCGKGRRGNGMGKSCDNGINA